MKKLHESIELLSGRILTHRIKNMKRDSKPTIIEIPKRILEDVLPIYPAVIILELGELHICKCLNMYKLLYRDADSFILSFTVGSVDAR